MWIAISPLIPLLPAVNDKYDYQATRLFSQPADHPL
jgi:hypothetical protein